jgi:hypothetical protein
MMFPKPLRRAKKREKVPDWLPAYIHARDQGCVPAKLGAPDPCSGRLTIEHVRDRDKPATGKRAPSDKYHTVLACMGHNLGWCLTSAAKEAERGYLGRVEGKVAA